ncbi:MAG TPA: TlpA disulfide reductase family protein [Terriglobales bacterium]|nr:TlpA disulfide reductase family protein [Terriglobales bacterium]
MPEWNQSSENQETSGAQPPEVPASPEIPTMPEGPGGEHRSSRRQNLMVVAVVIAAVAAMLIGGEYLVRKGERSGTITAGGPKPGSAAPDFALESLDGKTVHLSDFKGKAVLLNFWATWCTPCRLEMPWFVELQKQYGPEGLEVVGVAMDDASKDKIAQFAKEMGVNYPVLLGKESVGDEYGGLAYLPTSFYIDRDGKVVERVFGLRSRSDIEDWIKEALSRGSNVAQR